MWCCSQELLPRGLDIKQEELGDLVDKEMAATSAAIEAATARIEVCRCLHEACKEGGSWHYPLAALPMGVCLSCSVRLQWPPLNKPKPRPTRISETH